MYEQPKDQLIGKNLGQYTLLEEIGRGGMATVYRARQASMNRSVAVKILPPALMHDPGFYERFQREVDVISHLEHPHILPIYDFGQFEGMPYIVMRYLGGGSLANMIRRGPPPLEQLERPLTQVGAALDYAHLKGIIHGDIKPGNIMLDEDGNAYLSDFGIARVMGSNMTGSAIIGTPAYMSPEQATGAVAIDGRSDIYALGIVLFELLTGREPYQAETPMALLLKHINEPMPEARSFRADVPPAIDAVIVIATAKDPADRFASATEMSKAFGEAVRNPNNPRPTHLSPKSTPPSPGGTKVGAQTKAKQTERGKPLPTMAIGKAPQADIYTSSEPSQPNRLPMIIGVVVVLVVLVIGGAFLIPLLIAPPPLPPAGTPTPFSGSVTFTHPNNRYTLNVPSNWTHYDLSPGQVSRDIHVWQLDDLSAYVGVTIVLNRPINSQEDFAQAIADYEAEFDTPKLNPQSDTYIEYLDVQTAPDGTVRHSYRSVRSYDPPFPPGQTDRFYMWRGNNLVIVETNTAYTTGDTLVPMMQNIIDSLQVNAS